MKVRYETLKCQEILGIDPRPQPMGRGRTWHP